MLSVCGVEQKRANGTDMDGMGWDGMGMTWIHIHTYIHTYILLCSRFEKIDR